MDTTHSELDRAATPHAATPAVSPAYSQSKEAVLACHQVDPDKGLASEEVEQRRLIAGSNEIEQAKPTSVLTLIVRQFVSPVIWLLIAAAVIAAVFAEYTDAFAIAVVIILNAAIGFVTEYKARRSMEAIRTLGQTRSRVLRDGSFRTLASRELVPGDIVALTAGNLVPADIRIVSMTSLQASEAALTGESVPVEKHLAAVASDAAIGDRSSMLFKGTAVTRGDCTGVVTATGMQTEIGHITRLMMAAPDSQTPLEKQLQSLGGQLLWLTIALCVLISSIGMLAGRDVFLMIHAGIALAVAAIPEGLPIVATVALAGGMWRMAQRNALVERMAAVETLGSTTVIFTDKTGTLTENRLVAAEVYVPDGRHRLPLQQERDAKLPTSLRNLLEAGALCNHAELSPGTTPGEDSGDPLEIALLQAARDHGIDSAALSSDWPQMAERPFDSKIKLMTSAHRGPDGVFRLASKGAPERIIDAAGFSTGSDGSAQPLTHAAREEWRERALEMATSGLRVLAIAGSIGGQADIDELGDLILLGLVGFRDPPRSDVPEAILACQQAGIRVVMVTGDHVATASAISNQVGIHSNGRAAGIDGTRLDDLFAAGSDGQEEIHLSNVFARVTPEHKLRLVERMQQAGEIVAMTGDGVNDAPALRQADIGVAMGKRGTDVAREAADIVLLDDSFPTIVDAIAQGRVIFDNIRRFVVYLLSCNLSEVLVVALAILLGLPLALLPLQILFLNLVTDVFPAFALAAGKGDPNILKRPPRPPSELLIGTRQWALIVRHGLTITAVTLAALAIAERGYGLSAHDATTISFLTIAFAQLFHVFNMRNLGTPLLNNDVTRNPWVWGSLAVCIALLLIAVYVPPIAAVLQLKAPTLSAWLTILSLALVPIAIGRIAEIWPWDPFIKTTVVKLR
ncbi:MAG: cation-transporting P-type ATPase [Alphaproteobacteria bacterium]|nr:cation-transporting P-type ATPase [Alphaproteobacteria bacterium]